jgi:uncharacterized protein involved in exopolysaccharide biosynthesis
MVQQADQEFLDQIRQQQQQAAEAEAESGEGQIKDAPSKEEPAKEGSSDNTAMIIMSGLGVSLCCVVVVVALMKMTKR